MARFTSRKLTAPIVAVTMAGMLFVYSRTFIKAAKRNAERHREADGGQISWQNENERRHGLLISELLFPFSAMLTPRFTQEAGETGRSRHTHKADSWNRRKDRKGFRK